MEIYNTYYEPPKYYKVDDIETYISYVLKLSNSYYELAFRGESDVFDSTIASVFRVNKTPFVPDKIKKDYYREIAHSLTDIERENFLSYSQHHGLPTELLDITKIPLYALYFACSENMDVNKKTEEQLTSREKAILCLLSNCDFSYPKDEYIEYYGSKIANEVADIEEDETFLNNEYIKFCNQRKYIFNYPLITTYLELLGIASDIFFLIVGAIEGDNPNANFDKEEIFIDKFYLPPLPLVRYSPTAKFDRMRAQEGEFIYQLYGILKSQIFLSGEELKEDTRVKLMHQKINSNTRFLITDKRKILQQLNYLGINRKTIYPDADNLAKYIKEWNC